MIGSILSWWLIVQVISIVALPLTAFLFRHLPLRGYPFSKALGLLCVGYGGWLLAMLGLAPFEAGLLVAVLILVGLVGWRVAGRGAARRDLLAELRAHWGVIVGCEVLFAAALYVGLWLRWGAAWGPGINSTEKPMDMTFLSGILNSTIFPPQDPWLAGYSINYYYLGYVMVAALIRLSGVPIGEGFNLGLATILAMAAQMVAGLIVTMALLARRESAPTAPPARRVWAAIGAAALFGVLTVFVAGNQFGALQRVFGTSAVVALDGQQLLGALGQKLGGVQEVQIEPPFRAAERGVVSILRPENLDSFDWWWPSRAVWDDLPDPIEEEVEVAPGQIERLPILQRSYAITEFPFFSFYLGDMHPHVLVLPFGLLALALALHTAVRREPVALLAGRRGYLELALCGLILGLLYAINSWDAPTYALLFAGALALHYAQQARDPDGPLTFDWRAYAMNLGALALAALLLLAPFLLTFRSLAGNQPVPDEIARIPLLGSLAKVLALAPDRTGLLEFLAIFGLFFVLLLPYLISRADDTATPDQNRLDRSTRLMLWGSIVVSLLLGLLIGFPLLALLPLAITLTTYALLETVSPVRGFVLWTVAVVALVLFGTDIVYIRDFFSNRMNTIFKFYYQAWLIWGVVAGYAAYAFARWAQKRPLSLLLAGAPAMLLLAGALVYPWGTLTYSHNDDVPPVIDALAFLDNEVDERAALDWIIANTRPTDIVLTAAGEAYNETGRVATVTGRPTLLGWNGSHQRLWRSGSPEILDEIERRERAISQIYGAATSNDETLQLLDQYQIKYVYIGPKEREKYDGVDKFAQISGMQEVFNHSRVRIYERKS